VSGTLTKIDARRLDIVTRDPERADALDDGIHRGRGLLHCRHGGWRLTGHAGADVGEVRARLDGLGHRQLHDWTLRLQLDFGRRRGRGSGGEDGNGKDDAGHWVVSFNKCHALGSAYALLNRLVPAAPAG
jgi:hypothetical protein